MGATAEILDFDKLCCKDSCKGRFPTQKYETHKNRCARKPFPTVGLDYCLRVETRFDRMKRSYSYSSVGFNAVFLSLSPSVFLHSAQIPTYGRNKCN